MQATGCNLPIIANQLQILFAIANTFQSFADHLFLINDVLLGATHGDKISYLFYKSKYKLNDSKPRRKEQRIEK
jgi:hypothetical protein